MAARWRRLDRAGPRSTWPGRTSPTSIAALVLSDDPSVVASDRILVRLRASLPDRARMRAHLGTAAVDASVGRSGRDALDLPDGTPVATLRLASTVAVAGGDRLVLRRSTGGERIVGAVVLDVTPPRGISRRRQTVERVARLSDAVTAGDAVAIAAARLDLHGALEPARGPVEIADDLGAAAVAAVVASVDEVATLGAARSTAAVALRRRATIGRDTAAVAATALVDGLVRDGRLVRDGVELRRPGARPAQAADADPRLAAAMDRLEAALTVAAPPGLADAARSAGCPAGGDPGTRASRPDRGPGARPGLRGHDPPGAGGAGPHHGDPCAAHAGRVPRRHRDESQVRHGHPRRPRPARDPAAHRRRPRAGRARDDDRREMTAGTVAAVVLAGGRSSRFGRDKLLEPVDGRPLLHHAIEAVRPFASEILVVTRPDGAPPLPDGVTLVHDAVAFEGPLAGLIAGLAAARSPIVVVVGGDMPTLSVAVLGAMVAMLAASDDGALVLEHDGRARPLPMVLRREPGLAAAERLFLAGERRLRAVAEELSTAILPEIAWRAIDPEGGTLRDVDAESDLA